MEKQVQEQRQEQVQLQDMAGTNKWNMKDFITLAIFNVVMLIIISIIGVFQLYLIGASIMALLNGPVYMVMANKIAKRGILFFSCLLMGLYFAAFGFIYFLITMVVAGFMCELAMWGRGTYKQPVRNTFGFGLYAVGYYMMGVVPIIFFKEQYLVLLEGSFSSEGLERMMYFYSTPSMILISCALAFAGACVGCFIGHMLLKKHLKKARLV